MLIPNCGENTKDDVGKSGEKGASDFGPHKREDKGLRLLVIFCKEDTSS